MEKLSLLIQEKVQEGRWKAMKISLNGPTNSHLLFADDCLLFTETSVSQARLVRDVLQSFCLASGLKVNIQKLKFTSSTNIARLCVRRFRNIVQFMHTKNLGKYLEFALLTGRVKNSDFSHIMDNIKKCLARWKQGRAGRVTLAKLVVSALPVYTMQNLWLPEGVCNQLMLLFVNLCGANAPAIGLIGVH